FSGAQRRRAIGWILAGMAGAPIVGLPLLTSIAEVTSWRFAFAVLATIAAAASGLLVLTLPGSTSTLAGRDRFMMKGVLSAYRPLFADRRMRPLYMASLCRAMGWMTYLMYFGAFLHHSFGAGPRTIGLALMFAGGGFFAGSFAAGNWVRDMPLRPLYGVAAIAIAPVVTIAMALPVSVVVSTALLTTAAFAASASNVFLTTLLANETPVGSTTTQGMNTACVGIGCASGSAIGGALIVLGGYALLGVGLAGFMVLSAALSTRPSSMTRADRSAIEGSRA
ncbi:MAG TPA: MFS transporter, partial [Thermomicrobiales bacterium]|nr:MFS transporter [Thermomicrobiales bacterium]